jgi:ATPase family associated with various cellular activities (AAA)
MKAIRTILQSYDEGHPALFVSGRSPYDLMLDDEKTIRPMMGILRRALRAQYGMVLVTYSLASGLDYDAERIEDERDRRLIETALEAHHLRNIKQDQNEVVRVIRGISSLSRTPTAGLKWADGRDMRFAFVFQFAEHLAPGASGGLANGTQTDQQVVAIELAHITAQSLALRASGNLVMFFGRESLTDDLVRAALFNVHLPQPGFEEKLEFLGAASALYPGASFEAGLTPETVARLTANTPNRGLEALIRASDRSGREVKARELSEQKNRDVEEISEGTLLPLETSRIENLQLYGVNIAKPQQVLAQLSTALLRGIRSMPKNVLLAGAPGTAKTDLAIFTAHNGKAAAYQLISPKGSLVGETERKARLQQRALDEWTPNIGFIDEITEALPLERSEFDGDSGASRAVFGALLTSLSDESRRGRSLLISTTNRPWAMGAAMRSRFDVIPVLQPLKEDYAGIVLTTARRIAPVPDVEMTDARVREAADIFFQKGANPRHICAALSNALLLNGHESFTPEIILFAAHDLCASTDQPSAIYADLWAIKLCTSRAFLPWNDKLSAYPFPAYLQGVIDPKTGDVRESELNKRIEEYRPHANV